MVKAVKRGDGHEVKGKEHQVDQHADAAELVGGRQEGAFGRSRGFDQS
jgi:hypothetical protein